MDDVNHKYIDGLYTYLDRLDYLGRIERAIVRSAEAQMLARDTKHGYVLLAREWRLVETAESEEGFKLTPEGLRYLAFWADEHAASNATPNPLSVSELDYVSGLCEFLRELELGEKWFDYFEEPAAAERRETEIGNLEDSTDTVWEYWGEPDLPDRKFFDLACDWHLVDCESSAIFDVDNSVCARINQRGLAYLARWSDEIARKATGETQTIAAEGEGTSDLSQHRLHGAIVTQTIRDELCKHHVCEDGKQISIKNVSDPLKQGVIIERLVQVTGKRRVHVKSLVSTKFTELFWGKAAKQRQKGDDTGYDLYEKMCKSSASNMLNWFLQQYNLGLAWGVLGNSEVDEHPFDTPRSELAYDGDEVGI